ncbi:MAG TPA: sigma-54-dependent Fis family transcriptional regulator [Rhodocyclaceae bacterium]
MNDALSRGMNPRHPIADSDDLIARSWQRCVARGLRPESPVPEGLVARSELVDRLEANHRLLTYAQPVVEYLHQQIARSSSMVLLADNSGTLLRSVGDPDFVDRASRIALMPGAVWTEAEMGTNAVGVALLEQRPAAVFGDQHFLQRNQFLTCLSTPVRGPGGGLVGILDISSDARVSLVHAQALLLSAAELIENRLIETMTDAAVVIRFHPMREALGTPLEGLIAFHSNGTMLACNTRARQFLRLEANIAPRYEACFDKSWDSLLDLAGHTGLEPTLLRSHHGHNFAATLAARSLQRSTSRAGIGHRPMAPARTSTARRLEDLDQGDSRMIEAVRRAQRIAAHDIPLLIQGETGTGKEIFAQAFHHSGPRRDGPFVAINCAAIPASLIEAELFGYVEGAYTGARRAGARGKLREAHGGTLFRDEIGDMPLKLQAVLLRVLETRRVAPLGGATEEPVDIALVCASHHPLKELTDRGLFRADLFFRLSGMTVALPPLRERTDFNALVRQILNEEFPQRSPRISPEALAALKRHRWPGNLRQLRNALKLAVALLGDSDDTLGVAHLPQDIVDEAPGQEHNKQDGTSLRATEARLIREAVARNRGNISAAARELGITRTTLYRKLRQGVPGSRAAKA